MSPPVKQPIPRFIADATREGLPYGRWAQRLRDEFAKACEPHVGEAGGAPGEMTWFPERSWGGRVYVPGIAPIEGRNGEYFGYVSFVRPGKGEEGEQSDFKATADFTDVVVEDNPDWEIDLNEEVIGTWDGEGERAGDITLVWGTPLVRGALAATAELDREVVDQAPVVDERFTLVAVDAVKGFYDDYYLEIKLFGNKNVELATESLYEAPDEASEDAPPPS